MKFPRLKLKEEFKIDSIVSMHYFEFARDYTFKGESHDFWEFLYVDKGEAEVTAGRNGYVLKQGDIIFHKPNEFHSVWANHIIAPNIVVVSFVCRSETMKFFNDRIFAVGDTERNILGNLVREGMDAFKPPFDDPFGNTLLRRRDAGFASEQMVKISLQSLLISLVRRNAPLKKERKLSSAAKERAEKDVAAKVGKYFTDNIDGNLTLGDVCNHMSMSRTHLTEVFRKEVGTGVIERFKKMKVEKAKQLIREEDNNFTEIAEILGYSSIHSFSRHFKKVTDMSPSEYSKSVKSRVGIM